MLHYTRRQALYAFVGILAMVMLAVFEYRWLPHAATWIFGLTFC